MREWQRRGEKGKERQVLVDVLEAIGCEKCAEFVMLGAIDKFWKYTVEINTAVGMTVCTQEHYWHS